jgi:antirestriction protein ArdC
MAVHASSESYQTRGSLLEQADGHTESSMKKDVYQIITDRIIELLEAGTVPWHKPWKASTGWPRNLITNKPYQGVNVLLLRAMSYESPYWLTFRQATMLGGTVRKDEKACPVVFWKRLTVGEKDSADEREIPLLRFFHVFNLSQCDGIKSGHPAEPQGAAPVAPGKPDEIVANMPDKPPIKECFTQAFYSLHEDYIGMPARERFSENEAFYSALFHEMTHASGHKSRLNRPTLNEAAGFGSDPYCKEELVAEIGAAFLCAQAEIIDRTIGNSAAYVANWLQRLQSEKTLIIHAAAQAQRAADFILGIKHHAEGGDGAIPA